jgi:hypothetical protein
MASITFNFPYLAMNDVMKVVKGPEIKITNQTFDNSCQITITTRLDSRDKFTNRLLDIDGVTLNE